MKILSYEQRDICRINDSKNFKSFLVENDRKPSSILQINTCPKSTRCEICEIGLKYVQTSQ